MRSFKRAIAVTLLFCLCVGAVYTAVAEAYFNTERYYYQDADKRSELSGELDLLICGGSHGLRAFVPEIMDEELGVNSYNLSGSLMTMKGRYTLLKKEMERNDIGTVIIELSFNVTARNRDEEGPEGDIYVLGRLDSPMERLSYMLTTMRINEYDRILYDTFNRGVSTLITAAKHGSLHYDFSAKGYKAIAANDCSTTVESYLKNYNITTFNEEEYEENLVYLNKMAALCKENGVRTVIVVTPINDRYLYQHSNCDAVMNKHRDWAAENGFEYYDMNLIRNKTELFDDTNSFYDDSHLGDEAAEVFTKELSKIMAEAQAGKDVSDYFFSSYTQAEAYGKYRLLANG